MNEEKSGAQVEIWRWSWVFRLGGIEGHFLREFWGYVHRDSSVSWGLELGIVWWMLRKNGKRRRIWGAIGEVDMHWSKCVWVWVGFN